MYNTCWFSIHRAARMKNEFRSELDDGEGQGDMKRRQALIDKEKRKEVRTTRTLLRNCVSWHYCKSVMLLITAFDVNIKGAETVKAEEEIAGENEEQKL